MATFWQNKKVFLTGHTGFKGAWLSLQLQKLGAKVTGYALAPATEPNLFTLAKLDQKMKSKIGDVRDLGALKKAYQECQPDIVFHMAAQALVRPSYVDPVGTYATNVMGTVNLLEVARLIPSAQAVVNVTSDKCYENLEREAGYREDEPMGGHDPYSSSKGCSELVTAAYRNSFHLKLASARAGNVVGGGDWSEDRLVPDCLKALEQNKTVQIRNPNSIRPWQHVLEPLSGYLLLAEKLSQSSEKFARGWNFGPSEADAKPVSWIADQLVSDWGGNARWEQFHVKSAPHEAHYLKLDCSEARNTLGWKPRLQLNQTIQWIVDWHKRYLQGEAVDLICLSQIEKYLDFE
jgi:CDP-glucose 4,6-dehydratase